MTWWGLGVDLGTASCAAVLAQQPERFEVVRVEGESRTPTTVVWREGRLLAGTLAESLREANPQAAERNPRGRVGGPPMVLDQQTVPAGDALAALIELFVVEGRRRFDEQPPAHLVLTHPTAWGEAELGVLRHGAGLVLPGVPLTLVPEPVAAAVALWAEHDLAPEAPLAVYDLGGATLDVCVLSADGDVLASLSQDSLAGDTFDRALMDHFIADLAESQWWRRTSADAGVTSVRDLDELLRTVRGMKETLSHHEHAQAPFSPAETTLQVTRAEYEELIQGAVAAGAALLDTALAMAGLAPSDLGAIYLIGGTSPTPAVLESMRQRYGDLVQVSQDPHLVIARGAGRLTLTDAAMSAPQPDTVIAGALRLPPEMIAAEALAAQQYETTQRLGTTQQFDLTQPLDAAQPSDLTQPLDATQYVQPPETEPPLMAPKHPARDLPAAGLPAPVFSAPKFPTFEFPRPEFPPPAPAPAAQYPAAQYPAVQYPAAQYPDPQYPAQYSDPQYPAAEQYMPPQPPAYPQPPSYLQPPASPVPISQSSIPQPQQPISPRQRLGIVAAAVAVVLLVGAAGVLQSQGRLSGLIGSSSDQAGDAGDGGTTGGGSASLDPGQVTDPGNAGSGEKPASQQPPPGSTGKAGAATQLAGQATAEALNTAPDGNDSSGYPVSYAAANLTDSDLSTTWRSAGDASGDTLTFSFGQPVTITKLGMTNGYTKTDPVSHADRYSEERRITSVTWTFADGSTVHQDLADDDRQVQTMDIESVTTSSVTLTIDATTEPGDVVRDYTAISEVEFYGR